MSSNALRFGIGGPDGPGGPLYRLWVHGSDIYVAARSLAGVLKTSIHESGISRVAFTQQFADSDRYEDLVGTRDDRLLQRWEVADNVAPGLTQQYMIGIPADELEEPRKGETPPNASWFPNAQDGHIASFVIFVARGLAPDDWPGRRSMGTSLVARMPLANGAECVVVYVVEEMSARTLSELGRSGAKLLADGALPAASGGTNADLPVKRVQVHVDHESGAGGVIDVRVTSPLLRRSEG